MRWVVPRIVGYPGIGIQGLESENRLRPLLSKMTPRPIPCDGGDFGSGVRARYGRGVGRPPLVRGLPYSLSQPDQSHILAQSLRKDIRARRFFA